MKKVPDQSRLSVFSIVYSFRIRRKHQGERWKKRYEWRDDCRIVRCASRFEVEDELTAYIKRTFTAHEYDVKIVMISEVK